VRADVVRHGLRASLAIGAAVASAGMVWPPGNVPAPPSRSALRAAVIESARASRQREAAPPREPSGLERRFGVSIESLRTTAGGYLLDFRMRVLEPRRAAPLLARQVQPRLITSDGTVLAVPVAPKLGALRQTATTAKAGSTYFVLFANPAQRVRRGERVSVELGPLQARGVMVE
jgi:hypothetical protein